MLCPSGSWEVLSLYNWISPEENCNEHQLRIAAVFRTEVAAYLQNWKFVSSSCYMQSIKIDDYVLENISCSKLYFTDYLFLKLYICFVHIINKLLPYNLRYDIPYSWLVPDLWYRVRIIGETFSHATQDDKIMPRTTY